MYCSRFYCADVDRWPGSGRVQDGPVEAHLGRVNCNIPTIGNDCYIPSKAACLVVSNLIIAVRCVNAVQDRIMTGKQLSAGACGHLDIYKNQPVSQLHM